MSILLIIMESFLLSTSIFIFWVVKGGFHKRFLYKDNLLISIGTAVISSLIYIKFIENMLVILLIFNPFIAGVLFLFLLVYRFYKNPYRKIEASSDEFLSPADGRVIYIKELEKDQLPVSIKKGRLAKLDEITKTDILTVPCYLIGIAMTLFDVHINRAPSAGKVIFVKHTPGTFLGLNKPESTFTNERNTVIIERPDGIKVGIVQIAARYVKRCIISVKEGESVEQGAVIGKIRVGSQVDLIIPRNCEILVREADQVFAGLTKIAKLRSDLS